MRLFLFILVMFMFYSLTTVKERHDMIKAVIGDLDDQIVKANIIDDITLHRIGNSLGISELSPYDTER